MKTEFKKNILKILEYVLFIILLFPFIQQKTTQELPQVIQDYYIYGCYVSTIIMYIWIIIDLKKKDKKVSNYIIFFFMYWIYSIIINLVYYKSNIITYKTCKNVLKMAYILVSFVLFLFQRIKNNPKELLHSLAIIYHFYIIANFILFIIYPEGIYETKVVKYHKGHFLGDDNALNDVLLPGIIITILDSIYRKSKISILNYCEILFCIYTYLKIWSVTSIITFSLFIILLVINNFYKLDSKKLLLLFISVLLIVMFGLEWKPIKYVITEIFNKSITLTGRTNLYERAFEIIKENWLLGYGGFWEYGKFYIKNRIYHSHNMYLQIWIDNGLIGLSIFIFTILSCYRKMQKNKKALFTQILNIGLTCILIGYISDRENFYHLYIILAIIMNIEYFIKENQMISINPFKNIKKLNKGR